MFRAYRAAIWMVGGLLAALLLALVFTLGYVANGSGATSAGDTTQEIHSDVDFNTLNQILQILKRDYFSQDKLDDRTLYEAAINGIISSLADSGVFYIDPATFRTSVGPSGSFEGIGATVQKIDNQIIIVQPFQGSPAQAAGVQSGDAILIVGGEPTDGWTVEKAVLKIRGPKGSDVKLRIRHRDGQEVDLTITRDEIQVASVGTTPPGGVLRDANGNEVTDLAYMRISQFTEHTPSEVEPVVREAEQSGKRGLIIDLRLNPGGLLKETVETADLFLEGGVVLTEVDRFGQQTVHSATPGGAALHIPIVLLLDGSSASGAEVLAASLRDNGRATIIGENSFGKGKVNIERDLNDGGALFVTIREWLTPKGQLIDRVGITPDIEVKPGPLDAGYDPTTDAQLFRAIDQLHGLQATQGAVPAPATP